MREFLLRCLRRAPVIEQMWKQHGRMREACDAATVDCERTMSELPPASAERNATLAEGDAAITQQTVSNVMTDATGMNPIDSWQRNDRETCVCGTPRRKILQNAYQVLPYHDHIHSPYYYKCNACESYSPLNLYFNLESYSKVPVDAFSISDAKRILNRARVEWIRERAGYSFPYNPVVYDLGSGEGCFSTCFRQAFPHARIIAVETDTRLRERFATEYEGIEFVPERIEKFLARVSREPQADLVILTDVLEHAFEPELLLTLIGRSLKYSGFAYIVLPNANSFGTYPHHIPSGDIDEELVD